MGVPPALPGRQSNFENSGSIPPAVAFVFAEARCLASLVPLQLLLLFTGCDQAPLRGPATVKPPALPEDTYYAQGHIFTSRYDRNGPSSSLGLSRFGGKLGVKLVS